MSASKCGQRAVNRGEIGLQTDHASLKSSPSEIECINSRCGGCYADLPWLLTSRVFMASYGAGVTASAPNQLSRVAMASGDSSCVNKMASRFWGLEQAT